MRGETALLRDGRKVFIRPATIDDAAALLENIQPIIEEEVYLMLDRLPNDLAMERHWLSRFDGVRNVLLVALDKDAIVGQVECTGGEYSKIHHVGVIGIAVRDGWREVGLGRVLMERILGWMRSQKFLKAELSVFATNRRAVRLYESLGFDVEGVQHRRVRIQGKYDDEVRMGLWLGPEHP
ncbi:MAG TPA: GNAT family N-acetyltransferase [Thermoplasmata archaeon]|nr:GNAT family N-acetyltransferase [Thermoplasmata archaeon]